MQLAQPVSLVVNDNGAESTHVVTELAIVLIDDSSHKFVIARVLPYCRALLLWRAEAYAAAGDYTQAQVEARVLELLGENIQAGLQALVQ